MKLFHLFMLSFDGIFFNLQVTSAYVCGAPGNGSLELRLTTERFPVAYLLRGALRAVADVFYQTKANIIFEPDVNDSKQFR